MSRVTPLLVAAALAAPASVASAAPTQVVGGQTSVALQFGLLEEVAGLALSGVSTEVISPGDIADSVAFSINSRDADDPTTFAYDSDDFLGTFSGSIAHTGSVFFNDASIEVGDFTIGFDAARAGSLGGEASGFFVASTAGIDATLFDIGNPTGLTASDTALVIDAPLLVSLEFSDILSSSGLSDGPLTGAQVGLAQVNADAVPVNAGDADGGDDSNGDDMDGGAGGGGGGGGGAAAVPSPTAAAAGLFGLGAVLLRRRRA